MNANGANGRRPRSGHILPLTAFTDASGDPFQLPSTRREYGTFADSFVNTFTPGVIKVFLHQVGLYVSGHAWPSKKSVSYF